METITSKDNEFIKHIRKLKDKKQRDISNEYVIEGIKLVEEAIQEKASIKQIVICEDCQNGENIPKDLMYEIAKHDCIYVTASVLDSLKTVVNTQGILAVIGKENRNEKVQYEEDIIICLDNIQDPGNLGTILRTADSIGVSQIVLSKESADVYNPKVVRSTMGAIFRINIIYVEDLELSIKEMKKNKYKLVTTSLEATKNIYEINYNKKIIVIGNESNGVSEKIQELSNEKVTIPMLGKTESLNASVAAGVIMYEYVRQKVRR